jgi:hypothetical protein
LLVSSAMIFLSFCLFLTILVLVFFVVPIVLLCSKFFGCVCSTCHCQVIWNSVYKLQFRSSRVSWGCTTQRRRVRRKLL